MRNISIVRKINVLPGNILIVPGTEPSTTVTSTTMELEIRKAGRETPAIVDLNTALQIIPGSTVQLMQNFNAPTQKLFVLPAQEVDDCNCSNIDYYEILRLAARSATDDEKQCITTSSNADDYSHLLGS